MRSLQILPLACWGAAQHFIQSGATDHVGVESCREWHSIGSLPGILWLAVRETIEVHTSRNLYPNPTPRQFIFPREYCAQRHVWQRSVDWTCRSPSDESESIFRSGTCQFRSFDPALSGHNRWVGPWPQERFQEMHVESECWGRGRRRPFQPDGAIERVSL